MGAPCCPTCGRAYPKPKRAPQSAIVDTARMSEQELRAHYKRTAPVEDVRFGLRPGRVLPDDLRARWEELATNADTMNRAEVYRRLNALQCEWRRWRNAEERAKRAPYKIAQLARVKYIRVSLDPARLAA
jgi:hypothetical protein